MAEIITAVLAYGITALLGFVFIPWLRMIKCGQSIKEIGPVWHAYKEGTPTMGGFMFIIGFLVSLAAGCLIVSKADGLDFAPAKVRIFAGVALMLFCALLGFIDDFTKVKNRHNDGLTAIQKLVAQIASAVAYVIVMVKFGGMDTVIDIPFICSVDLKWFYYCLMVFSIVGIVNAVNLTDGLDGLASSVTLVVALGFAVICSRLGRRFDLLFCIALAGVLLGFLMWNFKPAKVFMGDTGSMFLGAAVVSMAYSSDFELLMLLSGILYVCEAFSVIIQRIYFKLTHGKRIFKMSPIHHHFELCGWSEVKIILVFSAVAAAGTALSILAASLK